MLFYALKIKTFIQKRSVFYMNIEIGMGLLLSTVFTIDSQA